MKWTLIAIAWLAWAVFTFVLYGATRVMLESVGFSFSVYLTSHILLIPPVLVVCLLAILLSWRRAVWVVVLLFSAVFVGSGVCESYLIQDERQVIRELAQTHADHPAEYHGASRGWPFESASVVMAANGDVSATD